MVVKLLRKVYFPVGIIVGLALFGLAGYFGSTDDGAVRNREGLEAVTPVNTSEAQFSRTLIVADLADGYEGTLKVDDLTIPGNQLEPPDGLNRLSFRPGDGKVISELRPRENCAEVTYRPVGQASSQASTYRWCFNVV